MKLTLKIWRQKDASNIGRFETYQLKDISPDMSFLEMLDVLNEKLVNESNEAVAFDHDCREGICGSCGLIINGVAHGPQGATTTCQLHMRKFHSGQTITIEPWRAKAFPIVKDLIVDRSAFDRIIAANGFISVNTGNAQDANQQLIGKQLADKAMDAAVCIGCGACVAACENASAMLFVAAKNAHLNSLPQGKVEKSQRVQRMVTQMDKEGFGNCRNQYECEAVCPKEISKEFIADMNREYLVSSVK